MQIRLGELNVNYCVSRSISMSRSFDIKLDKIREFYQTFNICWVHFKMIADKCLTCSEGHALYEKVTVIQWPKFV